MWLGRVFQREAAATEGPVVSVVIGGEHAGSRVLDIFVKEGVKAIPCFLSKHNKCVGK